jgi:hypothetical protein
VNDRRCEFSQRRSGVGNGNGNGNNGGQRRAGNGGQATGGWQRRAGTGACPYGATRRGGHASRGPRVTGAARHGGRALPRYLRRAGPVGGVAIWYSFGGSAPNRYRTK